MATSAAETDRSTKTTTTAEAVLPNQSSDTDSSPTQPPPPSVPTRGIQSQTRPQPPPSELASEQEQEAAPAPSPSPSPPTQTEPLDPTIRRLLDNGGLIVPENITEEEQIEFVSDNFGVDLSHDKPANDSVVWKIVYRQNVGNGGGGDDDEGKVKNIINDIIVNPFCAHTFTGFGYNFWKDIKAMMDRDAREEGTYKNIEHLVVSPISTVIELLSDDGFTFRNLTIGNSETEPMPHTVVDMFLSAIGRNETTVQSLKLENIELDLRPLYTMTRFSNSLKKLTLAGIYHEEFDESQNMAWNDFISSLQMHYSSTWSSQRLESVKIEYCYGVNMYSGMIRALQHHPTLRELKIQYGYSEGDEEEGGLEERQIRYSNDLEQLAILLRTCPSLAKFCLGYGDTQHDASIRHLIVEGLEQAKSLTELAMFNVDIKDSDARYFGRYLESNTSIQKLMLHKAFTSDSSGRWLSSQIILKSLRQNKNIVDLELYEKSSPSERRPWEDEDKYEYGGIDQIKLLMQEMKSLRRIYLSGDGWLKSHKPTTNTNPESPAVSCSLNDIIGWLMSRVPNASPESPSSSGAIFDVVGWFRSGLLTHLEEFDIFDYTLSRDEIIALCALIKTNNKNAHQRLRKFHLRGFEVSDDITKEESLSLLQNALEQNPFGFTDLSACVRFNRENHEVSTHLKHQLKKWNELSEDMTSRSKPLVTPMIPRMINSMSNPSMVFNAIRGSLVEGISRRSSRPGQEGSR